MIEFNEILKVELIWGSKNSKYKKRREGNEDRWKYINI